MVDGWSSPSMPDHPDTPAEQWVPLSVLEAQLAATTPHDDPAPPRARRRRLPAAGALLLVAGALGASVLTRRDRNATPTGAQMHGISDLLAAKAEQPAAA